MVVVVVGHGGHATWAYVVASALAEAAAPRVVGRLEPRPLFSRASTNGQ
jgi:NAD(P)H-hydrate repair Nnr-like enzyme with NAD(P)H-hydrate epimerase domain